MPDNDPLRDRVNLHKGRFQALADEAHVSYSWLCKFAAGAIPCPRADTRARLYAATEAAPTLGNAERG